jgi:hypothetical protein
VQIRRLKVRGGPLFCVSDGLSGGGNLVGLEFGDKRSWFCASGNDRLLVFWGLPFGTV